MFSTNRGTTILPVNATYYNGTAAEFKPIYWVASHSSKTGEYFVKMAMYNGTSTDVSVDVPSAARTATLTTLSAPHADSYNSPRNETSVYNTSRIHKTDSGFRFTIENYMVAVIAVHVG